MNATKTNVVSFVSRWADRRERREHDRNTADDTSPTDTLAEQLKAQNAKLGLAIHEIELARDRVDLSASDATMALHRFEQTLSNLRLSLENQHSATLAIDSAKAAGEAAARVKALLLDVDFDPKTVLRHDLSAEVLLRELSDYESDIVL